jgi:hypothetical protein
MSATKTKKRNRKAPEATVEKSKPMIVLTEDQRTFLNEIRVELGLKNQNEALQVLIDVASANRTKGHKDQFVAAGEKITHERNRTKNASRIAKLQAMLDEAKKLEGVA